MTTPPDEERRPEGNRAAETTSTASKIESILGQAADINHGCHCGPLGLDGILAAAALGIYCAPGHCAYDEMRVAS